MTQINQYSTEALTLGSGDFLDLDVDQGTGGPYESQKLKASSLISSLGNSFLASCNTVTITQESDFPAGNILDANTTYLICGQVILTTDIKVVNENTCVFGFNPTEDVLVQSSASTGVFRVSDQSFTVYNVGVQNPDGYVWSATNYTVASDDNHGRNKRLSVQNLICTNCDSLGSILGFDLVDFTNIFHQGIINDGILFQAVFHLQLTSCEFYKFHNIGLTFNPLNMVELEVVTAEGIGFGVVNINNCIFHPEVAQNGLVIHNTTTISLSTITGNSFADAGLTTGTLVSADFDIHNGVIIEANNGYRNYKPIGSMVLSGNTTDTVIVSASTPVQVNGNNAFTFPLLQRVIGDAVGELQYNGTEPTNFSITVELTVEVTSGTNQVCKFYMAANSVVITSFSATAELDQNIPQTVTFSLVGFAEPNDGYTIWCENTTSTNDILVSDVSLSGFGF